MNPYTALDDKAFWKLAVANRNLFDISSLWDPKFNITTKDKIVTFGSCFAQHIGRALQERGFLWHNTEPAPRNVPEKTAKLFNYNVFSARTGNIYTASLLKQWVEWALELKQPPDEYWAIANRYYDPFRPNIEPNGFQDKEEMLSSRQQTIVAFRKAITDARYFIFTLGLTESWVNQAMHVEYPMCPGTIAGEFSSDVHKFHNQDYNFILKNLNEAIQLMRGVNSKLKFILTISPVPLTATNSGLHVLVATMASKSILRAVAAKLVSRAAIDYFPSYEIINSPAFKGIFFEPNQRSVNPRGVSFVMDSFFNALIAKYDTAIVVNQRSTKAAKNHQNRQDVVCEEEILSAFGGK
ncbi:GSCFA domain-containing protein [Legionella septentrionalis]|uniref:GSCFA family protein n=1 Tax=Legionella septentrionalis TaxID=2498109 RepID=A0A433JM52_9GAMM|nr:GSCFA domain-containing protein [Legionella septentrionalis]RUQ91055.1 GSCFA family protein [Legionella septentrionalis]RUR02876.1 GSCFA family protein [Legionella septentrionalis]RUR11474.1 GSCFA family protein [Legionella septentrionalis]RUR16739.1 GSCFA family protein [Legionella septentrionalis]